MKISKILTAAFSAFFILGSYSVFGLTDKVNAATITVNDWDSLNQAVSNAEDDDVITLGADITTNAMISVDKRITIDLNGNTLTRDISSADPDGHVIYVGKDGNLTLTSSNEKGTVTGGFAYNGGGINNKGTLTIENIEVTGNQVGERENNSNISNHGGGIYNEGVISMNGCVISNNIGNTKESNKGGGIYNNGTITMVDCEITGNTSNDGGGIYNLENAKIILTNVEISGNESKGHGGGGITNYGDVHINGCTITDNESASDGTGIWNNRGLYIQGKVTVNGNTSGTGADNIFVKEGQLITIEGALDPESYIGISLEDQAQKVTEGWTEKAGVSSDVIHFDNGMMTKVSESDNEIYVGGVAYVSRAWDDESESVKSSDEVCTDTINSIGTSVGGGWYYVYGKKDIGRITLSNNTTVNIILADGAELKCGGIFVPENTILNIYGQKEGSGRLIAKAESKYQAGIGGNDETGHGQINIYGGIIEATGNDFGAGIGSGDEPGGKSLGDIQIFGGEIYAQGGVEGAGIGGGNESPGANIYIFDGDIVASGDNPSGYTGGAGIGGGDSAGAGHIEIKGGTIKATGGSTAAGIGGGPDVECDGTIIISGGNIEANGGDCGAGIGSGIRSDFSGNITISGGTVRASCEQKGAGIGSGMRGDLSGTITISGGAVKVYSYGEMRSEIYSNATYYMYYCGAGIGAGASGGVGQNARITISGGNVESRSDIGGAAIGAGSRLSKDEHNSNAGVFLGTVTISGGNLELYAGTDNLKEDAILPETIGHGVDCASAEGTVTIADGMCVAQYTYTPVSNSDRVKTSRSDCSGKIITIKPCSSHRVDTFTSDSSSTHSGNCKYCNEHVEENHKMQGNTCTVCGYVDDSIVKVTVSAGDGTGTSVSTWETIGDEYTLPECSFTAPSGKVFDKWTVSAGNTSTDKNPGENFTVSSTTNITAKYRTLNEYTISFVTYDDDLLSEIKVTEGQIPEYSGAVPSKPGDASYEYVFAGWDKEIVPAAEDTVYKAVFTEIAAGTSTCLITFLNEDKETVLWSGQVAEGTIPTYPLGTPTKEADDEYTYSFSGWDPALVEVTESTTYTAVFGQTKRSYTILFINEDGTLLQSIDVEYGKTPVFDETITPLKVSDEYYTYEFDGWDKEIAEVTGEAVYTAQFKAVPKNFDIRFVNYDDSLLQYVEVPYGTMPSYTGDTPVKPGDEQYSYTFLSWTPSIEAVEGAATYKATYYSTTNKYTVTFENEDGTVLQSQTLEYGEMPSYKGSTPEKEEDDDYIYNFAGWDVPIAEVTETVVYTATYKAIEKTATVYTIKFVNDDGTVLQTVKVAQGDMPEYTMGTDPVKKADNDYSYEFTGWTPAVMKAYADATYKATYKATPIKQVYNFVEGSPSVYVQGSGDGLVETIKCTIDDPNSIDRVLWVAVDGTQLTLGKEYSLKQGSTIVTLFSSYLDTLSAGEHVLLVNFTDGSVSMKFTIEAKNTSGASIPATGEEMNTTNISIALLLVAASLGCMKYVVRTKRREEVK